MPGAPAAPRPAASPPPGCVVELRNLSRTELNGARGVCLWPTEDLEQRERVGVRLDDGREINVAVRNLAPAVAIEPAPGKGLAAVARLPLRAGDLVAREQPLLTGRLGERPDRQQYKALPRAKQRAIMELCDAYAEPSSGPCLDSIVSTNGLPRGPKCDGVVLCSLASRFNHSCAPNAEYLWVESASVQEVRAVRDVAPGEEVCVNYLGEAIRQPAKARQAQLREGFRFCCRCPVCAAASTAESDARRSRLGRLGEDILRCRESPEEGIAMAEEMLDIMEQERMSGPRTVAQVCNDAFELSLLLGDASETQLWAHMSYEAHRLGWGEDFPLTRRMREYAQRPPRLAGAAGAANAAARGHRAARSDATRSPASRRRRARARGGAGVEVFASPPAREAPPPPAPPLELGAMD